MIIKKILNNSVASCTNQQGEEVIIMGKGIGYLSSSGDKVDESKIEKIFAVQNKSFSDKFKDLLQNVPDEYLQVSTEIIAYTNQTLCKALNENIYLTLTDHINFAMDRYNQNMIFYNALFNEVKTFYNAEFQIGLHALDLIEKHLNVRFPDDEAASIALHIVNAEYNSYMSDTMKSSKIIPEILTIVTNFFGMDLNKSSLYYERFILHIKYFLQRILKDESFQDNDKEFTDMVSKLYKDEYECSRKIAEYIKNIYGYETTENELSYLALHIKQIRKID